MHRLSLVAARGNTVRLGSVLRRANASNQKSADNEIQLYGRLT
jgi:hypothetical protein